MSNANDYLKESITRIQQIKNQKKSRERRERAAKRKMDAHRNFIIGEMVCDYFPDMLRYQPQRSNADNAAEFAEFVNILSHLSKNAELLENIKKGASNLTFMD